MGHYKRDYHNRDYCSSPGRSEDPYSVALGDLDGDGDQDLAAVNWDSDDVSVLLGNGDGTFQPAVNYGAGDASTSVVIGDLDGDGDQDLAAVNWNRTMMAIRRET